MREPQIVVRWTDCETVGCLSASIKKFILQEAGMFGTLTNAVSFSTSGADMTSTLPSAATTSFSSVKVTDLRPLGCFGCS